MSFSNDYSLNVAGQQVLFPRKISKIIDFDNVFVVQTTAENDETNEEWFKINSIYGVSKNDGKIVWSRPGFEIEKQKKKRRIITLDPKEKLPDEDELVIYAISMIFYVNPNSGATVRQEQTK